MQFEIVAAAIVLPIFSSLLAAMLLSCASIESSYRLRCLIFCQSIAFLSSLVLATCQLLRPEPLRLVLVPGFIGIQIDQLSTVLLVGFTFIALVVVTFSERYMAGDSHRVQFCYLLCGISCTSSLLAAADNLFLSLICWQFLSLLLARAAGLRASKSASNLITCHHLASDLILFAATILVWNFCGTASFSQLASCSQYLTQQASFYGVGLPITCADVIALLMIVSFSIKSALFPFHRWLLAMLEAPTPLSGLLHAGVVNVSAIIAARLMPVLELSPASLSIWALISVASAVVGTISMSAQSDVKRKLVYSTVGQMGFMCLQCATGAIPAAIFHLLAHGLFKCQMFLQSGSAVSEGLVKRKWSQCETVQLTSNDASNSKKLLRMGLLIVSGFVAALFYLKGTGIDGLTALSAVVAAIAILSVFPAVQSLSLVTMLGFWSVCLLISAASLSLCVQFAKLSPGTDTATAWLLPAAIAVFAVSGFFSRFLARIPRWANVFYVFGLSGFYTDDIAHVCSRLLTRRTDVEGRFVKLQDMKA